MFDSSIFVVSLLFLATINQIDGLQCYKCRCVIYPGETACTEESDLGCVIEYVTESYCVIARSENSIEFTHNPNSALAFLESLHYIRATEEFRYSESNSSWLTPTVTDLSYGCDWNLCNTPRILGLLPIGLTYSVNSNLLTDTLIANSSDPLTSCLSCTQCANSTDEVSCPTQACNGTCYIDDHIDDPQFNDGTCIVSFDSECVDTSLGTSVRVTGTYYIDDRLFDVTEIDIYCTKNNCNDINNAQIIQENTTFSTQINDQLYFRPENITTTPSPTDGLFGCYVCNCERELDSEDCKILECTIEYRNQSYCEIVRDLKSFPGYEHITLGHVQREFARYSHYIHAEEELILYTNLSFYPPSIDRISYICDWELCNDARIVEKLTTSFQFNVEPWAIAEFLQGSEPLDSCLQCSICTNASIDIDNCSSVNCSSSGHCFIDQHIDDPQYDDCEYAFEADCVESVSDSSIIIIGTYNIDTGELEFDEVDVYCSLNGCNKPSTINKLLEFVSEDISLDPVFFFRPVQAQNTTTPIIITEPTTTSNITAYNSTTTSQLPTVLTNSSTTTASGSTTTASGSTITTSSTATTSGTSTGTTVSPTTPPNTATILKNSFCFFILFLICNLFSIFYH